jgi:hypothetical protein
MAGGAGAQVYPLAPDWSSADMQVSTGAAWADINGDGWLDLVVSNGNDISLQRVVVYFNNGAGALSTSPGWQSADVDYHGHLDVADVNGDGWMDVAVAVLLVPGGRPSAKVYMNSGGTLGTLPAWTAPVSAESFGVAFGDMNADGRPDLAVASGDSYNNGPRINAVYLNVNGVLSGAVSWQTATTKNFNNCLWVDGDRDGRLDLCYTGSGTDTFVYRNLGTALETTASWRTNDSRNQFALMGVWGDVTGDGRKELFIADNNQINAGTGRFRRYDGLAAGYFSTSANWTYLDGYTSAMALGDVNNDGTLDLCTGEWFGRTRYFLNTGSGLPAAPTWSNTGTATTTVERIVLGDVRNRAVRTEVLDVVPTAGQRLFFVGRQPIQDVLRVIVDGVELGREQFCWNAENGWVSVGVSGTASVRIVYRASRSLDMAVSNWDNNRPNQVYLNRTAAPCAADLDLADGVDLADFFLFLNWFDQDDPRADLNGRDGVDLADFFDFLNHFDAGC